MSRKEISIYYLTSHRQDQINAAPKPLRNPFGFVDNAATLASSRFHMDLGPGLWLFPFDFQNVCMAGLSSPQARMFWLF